MESLTSLSNRLAAHPRVHLASLPTPLQHAERLGNALGVELWIKRDDVGSLGLAGNKVRKLEFALGAALAAGADCVVTCGAAQSNHMRATAAAAARLGLRVVLVVRGRATREPPSGNLLLDRLFGAELRWTATDDWTELNMICDQVADDLRTAGASPYVVPAGCSSPIGVLGFVAAYIELCVQLKNAAVTPARLFHASTSGGTHAGLLLGRALIDEGPAPVGFDVGSPYPDPAAHIAQLATCAAGLLNTNVALAPSDVALDDSARGSGYGAVTPEATDAIKLAARTEGILFDPVYSGKGLAGVVTRAGDVEGPVVLWHTGGAQALFAHGFADSLL